MKIIHKFIFADFTKLFLKYFTIFGGNFWWVLYLRLHFYFWNNCLKFKVAEWITKCCIKVLVKLLGILPIFDKRSHSNTKYNAMHAYAFKTCTMFNNLMIAYDLKNSNNINWIFNFPMKPHVLFVSLSAYQSSWFF